MLIASALWGVVRPGDRIPYYRLSAKAKLDGIGGLAAFWRPALAEALPDKRRATLVVDMRSGAYAAAWKPKRATLLAVRAFSESGGQAQTGQPHGEGGPRRSRPGAAGGEEPAEDPRGRATLAEAAGFTVELTPGHLDVIVPPDPSPRRRAENRSMSRVSARRAAGEVEVGPGAGVGRGRAGGG